MNGSDKILYCTETEKEYSLKDIKKLDPNTQKNIMRNWFYSNFEDPANHTPYESKEGDILIFGVVPLMQDMSLKICLQITGQRNRLMNLFLN